ncbi:MarR family transcriptional regulator [Amycolatopsis anabasis]|uniref:MarR family transcriptional regulator n=1 Tax=Amycolatopsis anabasis TaxID=1840409 RepID=UPI00131C71E0|nr:MarR family transcriptional regulator [Amycolatopsis anabasis]
MTDTAWSFPGTPEIADVEAAIGALYAMVDIADSTLAEAVGTLSLSQFHTLRIIAERTPVNVSQVADALDMNPSSVTRTCARLATLRLVRRRQNPLNRREVLLAPTARGHQVLERVRDHRRNRFHHILNRLDAAERPAVTAALARFAEVAAQPDR